MARVILGVGAGIAAYKACELLRRLRENGHRVRVVPTSDALRFVGAPTWEALSGEPVATDVWTDVDEVPHVRLGQTADLVIVAPATADLLARAAAGMASDLLTSTLLTARCPVIFAPAMHTEMWQHPATQANVATLRSRGATVVDPAEGRLAGKDSGPGRLPEPAALYEVAERTLTQVKTFSSEPDVRDPSAPARPVKSRFLRSGAHRGGSGGSSPRAGTASLTDNRDSLVSRRILISAGGTREELDPVRFLGNWSSGRQGYAFARAAVARGAEVTVVAANVELPDPAGAKVVKVVSARDMHAAMLAAAPAADVIVMTAAVADYRPVTRREAKIKKEDGPPPSIELTQNPDILAGLSARRAADGPPSQVIVGFAAETDPDLQAARAKLARKGCDFLVVNQVGNGLGFGTGDNEALVLGADGSSVPIGRRSKDALAEAVLDLAAARIELASRGSSKRAAALRCRGHINSTESVDFMDGERTWAAGCLPRSLSPRGIQTRWLTRSATRSWTP